MLLAALLEQQYDAAECSQTECFFVDCSVVIRRKCNTLSLSSMIGYTSKIHSSFIQFHNTMNLLFSHCRSPVVNYIRQQVFAALVKQGGFSR